MQKILDANKCQDNAIKALVYHHMIFLPKSRKEDKTIWQYSVLAQQQINGEFTYTHINFFTHFKVFGTVNVAAVLKFQYKRKK